MYRPIGRLGVLVAALSSIGLLLAACVSTPPPPTMPTGLTAAAGMRSVELEWDLSDENITHYNVYQGTQLGSLEKVAQVAAGSSSHLLSDLPGLTTYFFALTAENLGGESPPTPAVAAMPFQTGLVDGQHLVLAGSPEQYLEIPHDSSLNPTDGLTIEGRLRMLDASPDCLSLVGKGYLDAYWVGVCDGTLRSYVVGGTSARDGGTIPLDAWTHFAVTSDGTTRRHYLNGVQVAEFDEDGPPTSSTDPLRIGSDAHWAFSPAALLDEIRLWDRALSAVEIQGRMNQAVTQPLPGLLGAWPLDIDGRDALGSHHGSAVGTLPFGVEGTLHSGSPTMLVAIISTPECTGGYGGVEVRHQVLPFYIGEDGEYTLTLGYDAVALAFYVYENEFDPENGADNCIGANNSGNPMVLPLSLTAGGPYYAVVIDDTFAQDQDTVFPFSLAGPNLP